MFRETPRYGLRVHILERDCQGVKCHISFEDFLAENDIVIEQEGLYKMSLSENGKVWISVTHNPMTVNKDVLL